MRRNEYFNNKLIPKTLLRFIYFPLCSFKFFPNFFYFLSDSLLVANTSCRYSRSSKNGSGGSWHSFPVKAKPDAGHQDLDAGGPTSSLATPSNTPTAQRHPPRARLSGSPPEGSAGRGPLRAALPLGSPRGLFPLRGEESNDGAACSFSRS
jgi:hypothetical protein